MKKHEVLKLLETVDISTSDVSIEATSSEVVFFISEENIECSTAITILIREAAGSQERRIPAPALSLPMIF